jgi:hypothetical protein
LLRKLLGSALLTLSLSPLATAQGVFDGSLAPGLSSPPVIGPAAQVMPRGEKVAPIAARSGDYSTAAISEGIPISWSVNPSATTLMPAQTVNGIRMANNGRSYDAVNEVLTLTFSLRNLTGRFVGGLRVDATGTSPLTGVVTNGPWFFGDLQSGAPFMAGVVFRLYNVPDAAFTLTFLVTGVKHVNTVALGNIGVGVAVDNQGKVFTSIRGFNQVLVTTERGLEITRFGGTGTGDGQFTFAAASQGLAVDPDGNILVGDSGATARVQLFDP